MATVDGNDHYEAIVVGSGQGGTPLAAAFAKAGKRTLVVEEKHIGGSKSSMEAYWAGPSM
jgi:pyruvate/2-oxoglutarate dehydrogenase complex dihydrolipoamide dehydrogenase (E3) component